MRWRGRCSAIKRMVARGLFAASFLVLTALATACGAVAASPEEQHEPSVESHVPTTPPMWGKRPSPTKAACEAPTPLLVHHDDAGHVDRLHAQLTARGMEGNFLVDTGSRKSFATHSGLEEPPSASTVLSCTTMSLPIIARLRPGTTPDGQPQGGVLGSDLVAHGSVLDLDLVKNQLAWYEPAPAPPPGAVVLPIEMRNGWLVASGIRLGDRDVKLVVDTGASNVIYVDKAPRPNEVREETVDGTASPITLFHGQGELALAGGAARHVPVDRTDSFPTLEGLIEQLGSDVVGLLGLTALGRERIVISGERLMVVLPPIISEPR